MFREKYDDFFRRIVLFIKKYPYLCNRITKHGTFQLYIFLALAMLDGGKRLGTAGVCIAL